MTNKNWSKELAEIHKLEAKYDNMDNVPDSVLEKLHKKPDILADIENYTGMTRTQYNAIERVMAGEHKKTNTEARELGNTNTWLDNRIQAIEARTYYVTEDKI